MSIVFLLEDFFKSKLGISWQSWDSWFTLMTMSSLEAAAAGTLGISLLPFLRAWDLRNAGGRKYRRTVKKLFYLGIAVATVPLGILVGSLARIGALVDPRPLDNEGSLKAYLFRRRYQARHLSGRPVWLTLASVRETDALHAVAV